MFVLSALTVWTLGYVFEFASPDPAMKLWWAKAEYLGLTLVPAAMFIFSLRYTGYHQAFSPGQIALLFGPPLIFIAAVWTNPWHHLMWSRVWLDQDGPYPLLVYQRGFLFWLMVAYSYGLILAGSVILFRLFIRSRRLYHRQFVVLLLGLGAPWLANALYISGLSPWRTLDLTPFALCLTGLALVWGLFRVGLLDLLPIAHKVIIDGLGDPVIVIDLSGRVVDLNPAAQQLFGNRESGPIGLQATELVPDLAAGPPAGGRPIEITLPDGPVSRSYDLRLSPLTDRQGRPAGRVAIMRDITEQNQARAALTESENRYRMLFEAAGDSIFLLKDGLFVDCNQRTLELFGCGRADILGRPPEDFSPPCQPDGRDSAEKARELINKALASGPQFFEWTHQRLDGRPFDAEISLNRVEMISGPHILVMIRDVTERRRAEKALAESEARLRTLYEQSPLGLLVLSPAGEAVSVNQAWKELFGGELEELAGYNIFNDGQLKKLGIDEYLREVLAGRPIILPPVEYDTSGRLSRGRRMWVKGRAYPIMDAAGQAVNIIAMFEDVTASVQEENTRRLLEEQLAQAQKMQAVGTLASGIAHDFNNILQVISGYVQLVLTSGETGPKNQKYLGEVDRAVERASDLVLRLLTFSRRVEPKLMPVDLNRQLGEVIRILERTIPKMISLQTDLAEGLAPVRADPNQLERLIMNLATNARDAMPDGGRLSLTTRPALLSRDDCRRRPGLSPGLHVRLTVKDTGEGMDKETLERMYEPFFTTKALGQGSGLGLATVYGIVRSHGGHIACRSQPGQGTTFDIYLPAAQGEPAENGEPEPPLDNLGGEETILVVDDEEQIVETLREMLQAQGYGVLTASSGEEALDLRRTHPEIDLVVLDLGMPGMGGHGCLKEIKHSWPAQKVIIASGYSPESPDKDPRLAGAAACIGKPYRMNDLFRAIRTVLDGG